MRRTFFLAIAVFALSVLFPVAAQEHAKMTGIWQGTWYRGMTSGLVTLELGSAGAGTIRFTNLETFGEDAVELKNVEIDGKTLTFRAEGKNGAEFKASVTVTADGSRMRGNGRYEGFGVRFEARPKI